MILKASELRAARQRTRDTNHETYKLIYQRAADTIQRVANRGGNQLLFQIPDIYPGRPVYDTTHACNYVSKKLELGGFRVSVQSDQVLLVRW